MKTKKGLATQKQIIGLINEGYSPREIINEHGFSSSAVYEVLKKEDLVVALEEIEKQIESYQLLEEAQVSLLKNKQKITDKNNLQGRQLRAINRKDNYYEALTEYFENNIKIDLKDNVKVITEFDKSKTVDNLLLSDLHADELISQIESVWNEEFNFNIFQQRLKLLESKVIRKQLKEKNQILNIFLIWDIVSWMIHEELYENGEAGKFDVLYKTAIVVSKFINNLSKYWKNIYVHTAAWNHWRLSKQVKFKRTDENYDNILYTLVRATLNSNKTVKFNLRTEFLNSIKINNFEIWYCHGDMVDAAKQVKMRRFDLLVQGHYHQANYNAMSKVLTNGAFNLWNGYVAKTINWMSENQFQVSFQLNYVNWKMELWNIDFINITDWFESMPTYEEVLTENMIFGWNEFYEWNIFEITVWNYR